MKAVAAVMLLIAVVFAAGCHKDPENGGNNGNGNGNGNSGGGTAAGLYLGVIGFNDQLNTKPIGILNSSSEQGFINFIDALSTRDGTALYHAVNTSLDWLQHATLPEELMNVSIVTFTDGLDNASMMLNDQYGSQTEFLNAINQRIRTEKVGGLDINAYAIGMRGNDVQDVAGFQQNLRQLSSSPSNVFEVENMDLVTVKFREIATQLYNETTVFLGTGVKIPGGYDNNTVLRITFDNVNNANGSSKYIEGTYSRENGQGKLSNVVYCGLQSTSGTTVLSDRQDGTYYWFTFKELKTLDGLSVTNTTNMKLWRYVTNTAAWQPESEFAPSSYSEVQVDSKSAIIVLVLDCTTSLGANDFYMMKEASKTFVEVLGHYGDNGGGNGGDHPILPGPSIEIYHANGFINDGDVLEIGQDYHFGFSMSSEVGLSSLAVRIRSTYEGDDWEDEWEYVDLDGMMSYIYYGDLDISDKREIIGSYVFTATVTDVQGNTSSASLQFLIDGDSQPLESVWFEWVRRGGFCLQEEEMAALGLLWRSNSKDICANIVPLDGATLFVADGDIYDEIETESEKEAYCTMLLETALPVEVYRNVSVTQNSADYNDLLVVIDAYGGRHLIRIYHAENEATYAGTQTSIYGEAK